MLSQLFVLSPRGDLLLFRDYRGDADPAITGTFYEAVSALGPGVPPVAVLDYGYVQTSNAEVLRNFILSTPLRARSPAGLFDLSSVSLFGAETPPGKAARAGWLADKVGDGERAVYLDVDEELTVVIAVTGAVVRSEVQGLLRLRTQVSFCPEMRIALNEDLTIIGDQREAYGGPRISNVTFHPAVDLRDFGTQRVLRVTPVHGQTTLLKYQLLDELPTPLPFRLISSVEENPQSNRLVVCLKLRCDLPPRCHAVKVRAQLTVPSAIVGVTQELGSADQSANFSAPERQLVWSVPRLLSGAQLQASFGLTAKPPAMPSPLELGPLSLTFEVPGRTWSGLALRYVRFLTPHGTAATSASPPHRWVRYTTHSLSYIFHI
uniref:AP-4 complex subunit mu-1 isoform X2 n=1 Tax=Myxine glutinosa TaxID=7769 RepID=UPI00358F01EB